MCIRDNYVLDYFRFCLRHFSHNRANVELIYANYSCNCCNGFHSDAMKWVLGKRSMPSTMSMNDYFEILVTQCLQCRPATGQNINHNIFAALVNDCLGAFKHGLGFSGDVYHVDFAFVGFLLRFVATLQRLSQSFFEGVETLTAQVFIVFDDIAATKPCLVSDFSVVFCFQTKFGFYYCAHKRAFWNFEEFSDSRYAKGWPIKAAYELFGKGYVK